ncbi:MAG TPA: CBS domain-containing protein [Actinocrinis sp.]|nr:CBS domain-containing protein [Actinocrinis sp.]
MTTPVIAVTPGASLAQAARLMRRYEIKHLPVVDRHGALVGIVSRGDLLTPFLRPDADLHDEIVHDVLVGQMCVEPSTVDVRVVDGVVTVRGRLESEDVARETVRLVRALDGVVEVLDELTAAADLLGPATAPHFHAPMTPLP